MGEITIDQLFGGPWGIVKARRKEIESGPYGSFERLYEEEVERNFLLIAKAAKRLDCCESTARRWLHRCGARFIIRGLAQQYFAPVVESTKAERAQRKATRKSAA